MRRWLLATLAILALTAAACGGDDDDNGATGTPGGNGTPGATTDGTGEPANGETPDPDATPTFFPTNTPLPELPTPTPVPDDVPTMSLRYGSNTYDPTPAQFAQLEKTTVSGLLGDGVLLSTLAAQVGAPEGTLVTFRGYVAGQGTQRFVRDSLSALGSTTLLVLGADGHVSFRSTAVPQSEWLDIVEEIVFE